MILRMEAIENFSSDTFHKSDVKIHIAPHPIDKMSSSSLPPQEAASGTTHHF